MKQAAPGGGVLFPSGSLPHQLILYAYLGGQARRDITYVTDQG